jgi:hypothetical protein
MKLVGPIRKERATFSFKIRDKDVLVDRLYDPQDQLELIAKSVISKKLDVLSLQLSHMGSRDDEIERLITTLVGLEKFNLIDLSRFLDLVCRHTGNFHDPVFVIEAIAENVTRFQPDSDHAVIMAGVLAGDFATLDDPKKEKDFAAALKGN